MPRLLRGAARTAVIAGTATAVSNRVSRRQANRWAQQEEAQDAREQPYQQQPAPVPAQAPAAGAAAAKDPVTQLKELAELKSQGFLTDAEFQAQKAKILGT
ncbi:MAG TPA: SHOCT domain-containing protein [Trebonia sp.]|jgi:hypothetical protein|nr:SHOCT domain-containing protein [Trebonia sp.]